MAGIPAATITRMPSEWATTACWGMWGQTSPLNFSTADHIHCLLACTSTMPTERWVQGQIRERPRIQCASRHGLSASRETDLTEVSGGGRQHELLSGPDQ